MPGVALFRLHKLENLENVDFEQHKNPYSSYAKAQANKDNLLELAKFLCQYDESIWGKRIESNNIDIYTNDINLYKTLISEFNLYVKSAFEPNLEDLSLLKNAGTVVVKKLPHDKYMFKAFLLPHKMLDVNDKRSYLDWIKGQGNKILISSIVEEWFIKTNWNWDRRYVLVEDSQTLLMLKLRGPEVLGRVYDYVVRDK
jgi:hypothetical protein